MSRLPERDPHVDDELIALVEWYCDGVASDADRERLEKCLLADGDARRFFVAYTQQHAQLAWASRGPAPAANVRSPVLGFLSEALPAIAAARSSVLLWTIGVVTNLVLVVVLALVLSPRLRQHVAVNFGGAGMPRPVDPPAPRWPRATARLVQAVDCRWSVSDGDPQGVSAPRVGDALEPGSWELLSGIAEIAFGDGAQVQLAGPGRFEILDAAQMHLAVGQLRAHVPQQASGFAVFTPTAKVVDLGTEFGVEVTEAGESYVEVFRGQVEASPVGGEAAPDKLVLTAGQAARVQGAGQPAERLTRVPERLAKVQGAAVPWQPSEQGGGPVREIPLGNLFDDPRGTALAAAIASDAFAATPEVGDLGVERVIYGGPAVKRIAPGVTVDLRSLGWEDKRFGQIANDCYVVSEGTEPLARQNSISTQGTDFDARSEPALEDGLGMHANALVTLDLGKIRAAGGLAGAPLEFVCQRAGINDGAGLNNTMSSVHMVVLLSDAQHVLSAVVDGRSVPVAERGGAATFDAPAEPLTANGQFVRFAVPVPLAARFLTLAVTSAGNSFDLDQAVWSGARLRVTSKPQP